MIKKVASVILLTVLVGLLIEAVTAFAQVVVDNGPIEPRIPGADRNNTNRVFLERADELFTEPGGEYQILVGDVEFRRGPMFMFCDSAHFYDKTGSFDAFGNVRMEQGDTLFAFADTMKYDDFEQRMRLIAAPMNQVRLINKDVKLVTDEFFYDLAAELAYYETGGVLTDKQNRLKSTEGEYSPSTKEAVFRDNVKLTSINERDSLRITTDHLYYNTESHVAEMTTYTVIENGDGTIFTTNGIYNTETTQSDLFDRSLVVANNGNTLTGDTIYYNRKDGRGEVFGNMELNDTTNKLILRGNYGFYNELIDSAFVTGRAYGIEYSTTDSLFIHGDSIRAFRIIRRLLKDSIAVQPAPPVSEDISDIEITDTVAHEVEFQIAEEFSQPAVIETRVTYVVPDTVRFVVAAPRVKFYRSDLQGLCDSMTIVSSDSMIYLDRFPVVWNENRQITGIAIDLQLNDSTIDNARVPKDAFMAEMIEENVFNQLSGKEMRAYFIDGELNHLDVEGNVIAIMFPEENDSTINKIINLESSFLTADFKDNEIEKMKMWPQTTGTATPLYLAKKSLFYQPTFRWYEEFRPTDKEDIFNFPAELVEMFSSAQVYQRPPEPGIVLAPDENDAKEIVDEATGDTDTKDDESPEFIESQENLENLENTENMENFENSENSENSENMENLKRSENPEEGEGTDYYEDLENAVINDDSQDSESLNNSSDTPENKNHSDNETN